MVKYPKPEDISRYNRIVLDIARAYKADSHKILSQRNIDSAVRSAKRAKGDVEYKAAVLMKNLNQSHPFSSGNKRTAYFSANKMIGMNKGYMIAKKKDKRVDMAKRIREGRVNNKEIAQWLRK